MRPSSQSTADRPRRFYQQAAVAPRDGGFGVALDGRAAKTPNGAALVVPAEALAELLVREWSAQGDAIDLTAMPANRLAATVIDRTAEAGPALAAEVARYAGSDVICYVAEEPLELAERQARDWTPLRDWASGALGVNLHPVKGVIHQPQPAEALARVEALCASLEPFTLAGVAFAAPLFGSAVLALAVQRARLDGEGAFELSRLDEAFQEARWGVDEEAAARTALLKAEARLIGCWFEALRG